jgi:hypothetical protein
VRDCPGSPLSPWRRAMVIGVIAMCTMMFAGFGAVITLFATHF